MHHRIFPKALLRFLQVCQNPTGLRSSVFAGFFCHVSILLKDISSAGNCCKTKCTALFQKYLSISPMLYLNRYRLEKSVFLLRNTTMSVTEIFIQLSFI